MFHRVRQIGPGYPNATAAWCFHGRPRRAAACCFHAWPRRAILPPAITGRHLLPNANQAAEETPALSAFGGWAEAAWFNDSVLVDQAVVAFALPKIPGLRKQDFHVVDRTLTRAPRQRAGETPEKEPKRLAGKLAALLDRAGALRAVASSRTRLIFEGSPVLFFADLPPARLKPRPAAKLRRELVQIGVTACVLRVGTDAVTLMFWPSAETDITDFVDLARPDHRLHAAFSQDRAISAKKPADMPPARRDSIREAKLLQEIAALQNQVDALTRAQSALGAMEQLGLDDARLKSMLKLLHPDKHGNSEAANDAAKWLNSLRDLLRGKPAN